MLCNLRHREYVTRRSVMIRPFGWCIFAPLCPTSDLPVCSVDLPKKEKEPGKGKNNDKKIGRQSNKKKWPKKVAFIAVRQVLSCASSVAVVEASCAQSACTRKGKDPEQEKVKKMMTKKRGEGRQSKEKKNHMVRAKRSPNVGLEPTTLRSLFRAKSLMLYRLS